MAFNVQAPVADVVAAGYVRIAQLSVKMLDLLDNYQPAEQEVLSIIDLRQKLEALAVSTDQREVTTILGDLGETYGIPESIYTDPLYRPVFTIPASGAELRPIVLRIQDGKVLRIQGGKVLAIDYRLVPVAPPATTPPATSPVVSEPPATYTPPQTFALPASVPFVNKREVVVEHKAGRPVNVVIFDADGDEIDGGITNTPSTLTVTFSQPVSGTLYLS